MSKKKSKKKKGAAGTKESTPTKPPVPVEKQDQPEKAAAKAWSWPRLALIAGALVLLMVGGFFIFKGKISPGPEPKGTSSWNVLLITLDTTRTDRLGCYGYQAGWTPSLDELASSGVRFQNAYCQVPLTLPSHASILTGLNPCRHGVHNNGNYALSPQSTTLAEILQEQGMKTAAFVASFSVDSRFGLDQGFETYDDSFEPGKAFKSYNAERPADRVYESFARWLEKNYSSRFFAWVHFFDPHFPYNPPPEFARRFRDEPYDGEIAFMDRYVGRVMELIKIYGCQDRTLVVIAGDHGEAFGEKVEQGHGLFLYEMSVRVPFIITGPGLPVGQVINQPVQLVDIMPTVLDLLGLQAPVDFDGQSLKPLLVGRKLKPADIYLESFFPRENYGWSELLGLISGDWKFIQSPNPELYNLKTDPGENNNLYTPDHRQAERLKERLEKIIREASGLGTTRREMTPAEQERLRSLGYLQVAAPGTSGALPDPKDRLEELRAYQEAGFLEIRGKLEAAERAYARLVEIAPALESSYLNLSRVQGLQQKHLEAAATLRRGLEVLPSSDRLLAKLAQTLLLAGKQQEAREASYRALAINPDNYDALVAALMISEEQGRIEEALALAERALKIEPENEMVRLSQAENLVRSGRQIEAAEIYARLLADFPGNDFYRLNLAVIYNLLGEFEKSLPLLEQVTRTKPSPKAYLNLALACLETRRLPEAARAFEAYLSDTTGEDPENVARARNRLAQLKAFIK
ncbi:MAG: sulfatase-like hydrolase/transferase [Candidatus Saccharicenans sp.]|uniref:sulfatase-like hydrolase/transferase n=1 Tax=Candidatus Saccharicenans sp. TaxID=2819258 RepID=UPI004049925D